MPQQRPAPDRATATQNHETNCSQRSLLTHSSALFIGGAHLPLANRKQGGKGHFTAKGNTSIKKVVSVSNLAALNHGSEEDEEEIVPVSSVVSLSLSGNGTSNSKLDKEQEREEEEIVPVSSVASLSLSGNGTNNSKLDTEQEGEEEEEIVPVSSVASLSLSGNGTSNSKLDTEQEGEEEEEIVPVSSVASLSLSGNGTSNNKLDKEEEQKKTDLESQLCFEKAKLLTELDKAVAVQKNPNKLFQSRYQGPRTMLIGQTSDLLQFTNNIWEEVRKRLNHCHTQPMGNRDEDTKEFQETWLNRLLELEQKFKP